MTVVCPRCESAEYMNWNDDASYEELGIEGEGIVSFYECKKCGVWMEIYIPEEE